MRAFFALLTLAMPLSAAIAGDREPAESVLVEETVSALQAGNIAELQWLVTAVEPMQFFTTQFRERGEVFAALSGCEPKEIERGSLLEREFHLYEWKCANERYRGRLVPNEVGNNTVIADLFIKSDFKELERRYASVPTPPPPIPPLSEASRARLGERYARELGDRLELAEKFGKGFAAQDLSAFALGHGAYRELTFAFYDPRLEQRYVEKVWNLGETRAEADIVLKQAVGFIHSELGQPTRWSCEAEPEEPIATCTWFFKEPGTQLEAEMYIRDPASSDWGYLVYWFRYQTGDMLLEAERRAKS